MTKQDAFGARRRLGAVDFFSLPALAEANIGHVDRLPVSIKVLLEAALRNVDGFIVHAEDVQRLAGWNAADPGSEEIPFMPARVVLQDFTGVPAVVDLAALRDACKALGGDPKRINPLVPCDLVIDHSVQVDHFGREDALQLNLLIEFERNRQRYEFLKWGQQAFDNFSVVPPGTGIVHQVNLEYLASVVQQRDGVALPDSLVGTDSHTTMINGLGVVGWGVGGIEAEAVMLGQPIYMLMPQVVGFKLTGELPEGATATDLVLSVTQMLRQMGVVGQFVEFYGPGLASMSLPDRATIANMAPEYGATMGFFPVDDVTLQYMKLSGRSDDLIDLTERYCKEQGLWRQDETAPQFSRTAELDMSDVEPALAGPKRPQDRIALSNMRSEWFEALQTTFGKTLVDLPDPTADDPTGMLEAPVMTIVSEDPGFAGVTVDDNGQSFVLQHGDVVIAAITSCTNTSNPSVMLAAGLVAQKAVERGLTVRPWVKTSLAPGSRVVTDYLAKAGLTPYLDQLGFNLVGYGCTTCIGNSGPLHEPISQAVRDHDLVVCSVLSGNRNFEGRVNPDVRANYLASPPLVVAYAIAGSTSVDLTTEPLGADRDGNDVYLRDIWPTQQEIREAVAAAVSSEQFTNRYADVFAGDEQWQQIPVAGGELYSWDAASTYIQLPPFFEGMAPEPEPIEPIRGARVLAMLGDSVTTDHISPAGAIGADSPAGQYLVGRGVEQKDFNSFGSRRGNHEVMMRGTFGNIRIRNQLAPGTEGGVTVFFGSAEEVSHEIRNSKFEIEAGSVCSIYDAAMAYKALGVPLVVLAGKDYGMGSSRDWAAKGTYLLGVRAVIAESYERIHRSNLVGMGVLPLEFLPGEDRQTLGLTGREVFDIAVDDHVQPGQQLAVTACTPSPLTGEGRGEGESVAEPKVFQVICRIDTPVEVDYYRHGGILHSVVRKLAKNE